MSKLVLPFLYTNLLFVTPGTAQDVRLKAFRRALLLEFFRSQTICILHLFLQNFEKIPSRRPRSISLNAAVCDQKQTVHFVGHKAAGLPGG